VSVVVGPLEHVLLLAQIDPDQEPVARRKPVREPRQELGGLLSRQVADVRASHSTSFPFDVSSSSFDRPASYSAATARIESPGCSDKSASALETRAVLEMSIGR